MYIALQIWVAGFVVACLSVTIIVFCFPCEYGQMFGKVVYKNRELDPMTVAFLLCIVGGVFWPVLLVMLAAKNKN